MIMNRRYSVVGILFGALIGCQSNSSVPTEADAQEAWHHIAAQTTANKLEELVSLKKTDGQVQEVNGVKIYTLFYEAKVRYLTPVGQWKAGDVRTIKSNYGFQRTEKGWQGPDGTLYTK